MELHNVMDPTYVKFHHIRMNCLAYIGLTAHNFTATNSFLLLNTVALVYRMQETTALLELWAVNPVLYDARFSCAVYNKVW